MIDNNAFIFETEARSAIHRPGLEDLLTFLHTTDFYSAPCSGRYHGSYAGALVEHSLNVYTEFYRIAPLYGFDPADTSSTESAAIVCLFHDLCKINFYEPYMRNVKNDETGVWEQVQEYRIKGATALASHGACSAYRVMQFMKLTEAEYAAILHHMGAWDKSQYSNPGEVYAHNKLAWLLHVADEAATYIEGC